MYVIKVNIHDSDSEYLIFDDENDIKDFIKDNIVTNNVDYSNFYDNKRYSLDDYIYILRKTYIDDIDDIYGDNVVLSDEFWLEHKIENFENINENNKYFKKIPFNYDYKIIVNLDFSENDDSEDENINKLIK